MLWPLLTMMLATKFYYIASLFGRVRTDLLIAGKRQGLGAHDRREARCTNERQLAATFFAMGGYAAYVWPAYGVFFIVLLIDFFAPQCYAVAELLRELRSRLARQGRAYRAPGNLLRPTGLMRRSVNESQEHP
jgi:heme exporter protein D